MSRISRKKKRVADHDVKLLLNETIRHLGKVGDVVKVKPGYARNYLVPKGLAIAPTPGNLEKIESKRKDYEKFEAERRTQQEALLAKLEGHEVKLVRRANERGGLYGSVGASDIAHALREAGLAENGHADISADEINLHGKIDAVGRFEADVRFADDLIREITVVVEPDDESREAIEDAEAEQRERDAAEQAREQAQREAAAAMLEDGAEAR